jgi:stage II sporulation protein D
MKNHYDRGTPVQIKKQDLTAKATPVSGGGVIQVEEEKRLNDLSLKVLLLKTKSKAAVGSSDAIRIRGNDGLSGAKSITLSIDSGNVAVNSIPVDKQIELVSSAYMEVNGKKYRGSFITAVSDGSLMVINRVSLDEYLYGVLPSEVSPSWPKEALKAQAVAARSFALHGRMNSKSDMYDLDSDVSSQVYKGLSVEHQSTNDAIDQTDNEVLSKDGKVIQAFFHSNSGGRTASSEEVWGGRLDYLQPKDDPYCVNGQHYKWQLVIPREKLSATLRNNKLKTGELYDIKIMERTESGRVKTLKIYGSDGTAEMKGKDFRAYVGNDALKSTNFTVEFNGGEFTFNGLGWGHGVGLSQEGGKGMAEEGRNYRDILRHFYNGIDIKKARLE